MKKPAKLDINLLPKDPFLSSPIGKFLQWSLTVGRYLVIFTELIVILSFATRFNLDRRVTDLNGSIHQKEVIIQSYGDLEEKVRTIQKKIESYQQVEQQFNMAEAFAAISEITPQDVQLEELNIQRDTILFSGVTRSNPSLNLLINNLQLSSKFSNVSVERIQSATERDPGYHFAIKATMRRSN